jgi:hypothetical protein
VTRRLYAHFDTDIEVEKAMAVAMFGDDDTDGLHHIASKLGLSRTSSGNGMLSTPVKKSSMIGPEMIEVETTIDEAFDDELPKRSSSSTTNITNHGGDSKLELQPPDLPSSIDDVEAAQSLASVAAIVEGSDDDKEGSPNGVVTDQPSTNERKSKRALRAEKQQTRAATRAAGGIQDKDRSSRQPDRRRHDRDEILTRKQQQQLVQAKQAVAHAKLQQQRTTLQPLPIVRTSSLSSTYNDDDADDRDEEKDHNNDSDNNDDDDDEGVIPVTPTTPSQVNESPSFQVNGRKPRWRDGSGTGSGAASRRTSAAVDDAVAAVASLSSISHASSSTSGDMVSMSLSSSSLSHSNGNGNGNGSMSIELEALRAKNSELIRGHDVLTRQTRSLLAQNKVLICSPFCP